MLFKLMSGTLTNHIRTTSSIFWHLTASRRACVRRVARFADHPESVGWTNVLDCVRQNSLALYTPTLPFVLLRFGNHVQHLLMDTVNNVVDCLYPPQTSQIVFSACPVLVPQSLHGYLDVCSSLNDLFHRATHRFNFSFRAGQALCRSL